MNNFSKMNMLLVEARRSRAHRFNPQYNAFPNPYDACSADDFVSDEMAGYESINYLEFDGFKSGSGCKDFGYTGRGRRFQHRGRWTGRSGPNGGYQPHHSNHKVSDQHIKSGGRADLESQESTTKQEPDIPESGEAGPGEVVQETSLLKKDVNACLKSRRRERNKLKKLRQKERKAALKAQAAQEAQRRHTAVTSQDMDGATSEREIKAKREERKRKDRLNAAEGPKLKIVKFETLGDSRDKMEAEKAASGTKAPNPEAEGQSCGEPPSSSSSSSFDSERHPERTNKNSTPASEGSNTVQQNAFEAVSCAQSCNAAAKGQSCTEQSFEANAAPAANSLQQQSGQIRKREKARIYGRRISAQRLTFVCPVCKFSSFYKWKLKAHLKSKFHKDHFKFLSEHLSKQSVDFLKTHFSKKQQRVQDFIDQIPDHRATLCQVYEDRDLTIDISMEHFIRKAEAAHCLACDEYIPMQYYLIQLHLRSPDHRDNCKGMMFQSKNVGLSTVQRLLNLKCTRQKLERNLKDSRKTAGPKGKRKKVQSVEQRTVPKADTMSQVAVPICKRAMQADEAEDNGEDHVVVKDRKTQKEKPECEEEKNEVEPCIGQVIQVNKAVGEGKKHEVEPFCGLTIQADKVVRKKKDQEVKPLCGRTMPADEAVEDRKAQDAEPLSKGAVPSPDPVINGKEHYNLQESKQSDQIESLFDLLDEEDDLEGVELGEEEMKEDDL